MPLQMRLPKRGFKSPNRVEYVSINLDDLQAFAEKHSLSEVSREVLVEKRYVRKHDQVKISGRGEVNQQLKVSANACSAAAKEKIEASGGSIDII